MRLLTLHITEPLPGCVFPAMIAETSAEEAAHRYRATVLTTMRQLKGLNETRIRIVTDPEDAAEAVRFWLLPLLADRWISEGLVFKTDGWEFDFSGNFPPFPILMTADVRCPQLGARWIQAALAGIGSSIGSVIGEGENGEIYLECRTNSALPVRNLPKLPIIETDQDWQTALASAIGPALKKAWEQCA
ncbi:hypothetical protein JIN85_14580 [Luteolibacter pohnpeiensis]|uniref:Uncharacterized protein n=1 Tax=Luteolibacter pohnpeiensis TaxID=454153 RepID=A0A934S5V0_9BACT|nr:hypothetical protein [Luteolibacter pohnpeiensis]MBK1883645.1 hypothetical protein [Luteolibacter pohnpeiensis]